MAFGSDEAATLKLRLDSSEVEEGLQQTEQGFGNWASAIKSALAAAGIYEATQIFKDWALAGARISDVERNMTIDVTAASRAIDGQISRTNLIVAANRLAVRGVDLTAETFRAMAAAAADFGDRTGDDATQALEQLTQAVIRGSSRGLRPFGIEATTTAEALQQLITKFGNATNTADNAGEQVDVLTKKISDLSDQFQRGIAESKGFEGAMRDVNEALGNSEAGAQGLGTALGDLVGYAIQLNPLVRTLEIIVHSFSEIQRYMTQPLAEAEARGLEAEAASEEAGRRREAMERIRRERAEEIAGGGPSGIPSRIEEMGTVEIGEIEVERERGGGGGGRRSRPERLGPAETGAELAESLGAQQHWYDQIEDRESQNLDFIREIDEERVAEERAMTEFFNEQAELRLDTEREAANERSRLLDEEMAQRAQYAQTLISVGRAAIAEGKSTANVQRAITRAALEELARWAEQKAAWEAVEAIAAAARYDFGAAALHAAAAIGYGAIAVGASAAGSSAGLSEGGGGGMSRAARERRGLGAGLRGGGSSGLGVASSPSEGGRPVNVTVVYSPSTGGFIPDANIRDLLDQIGEGVDRGYRSA